MYPQPFGCGFPHARSFAALLRSTTILLPLHDAILLSFIYQ
jgi:hypothetical protein